MTEFAYSSASDVLKLLITVSERAADIARVIRAQNDLFDTLIEEKESEFKPQDYKTLADVLIQATVKYHISKEFPSMKDQIYGEESTKFVNSVGQEISLEVNCSPDDTRRSVELALGGRPQLIEDLITIIHDNHRQCTIEEDHRHKIEGVTIDTGSMGIWIDPIDGTNEYIRGEGTMIADTGIHRRGIQVALVLIGLYDTKSGLPIIGIINQPFHSKDDHNQWSGRIIWGLSKDDCKVASVPPVIHPRPPKSNKVCLLSSVDSSLKLPPGWDTHYVSGCGYKFLCVIDGLADAFILTMPSSYKWDTCAPQPILTALGGEIVSWVEFINNEERIPILYHRSDTCALEEDTQKWSNVGGVLAYRDTPIIETLH